MSPQSLTCSSMMVAVLLAAPAQAEEPTALQLTSQLTALQSQESSIQPALPAGDLTFWRDLLPPVVVRWVDATAGTWLSAQPPAPPVAIADPVLFATRIQQIEGVRR